MNARISINAAAAIAALVVAGSACSSKGSGLGGADASGDAGVRDSGTNNPPPDSGTIEPDAGSEDGSVNPEDAGGAPARNFVERRMFGSGRIDNLVFDPNFDLGTYNWYAFTSDFTALVPLEKHFLPRTPTQQPAVRVQKDRGRGALMLGSAASQTGMLEASVWIARTEADAASAPPANATIIMVGPNGPEVAVDLVADAGTQVVIDGLVWMRHTAIFGDAIGVLAFLIGDNVRAPFWVTAPSVVAINASIRPAGGSSVLIAGRPLEGTERRVIAAFQAERRSREDPRKIEERSRARGRAVIEGPSR